MLFVPTKLHTMSAALVVYASRAPGHWCHHVQRGETTGRGGTAREGREDTHKLICDAALTQDYLSSYASSRGNTVDLAGAGMRVSTFKNIPLRVPAARIIDNASRWRLGNDVFRVRCRGGG